MGPTVSDVQRCLVYKKTGNLRACQLLLGHRKLESTVRYLGIEVDDVWRCRSKSIFDGEAGLRSGPGNTVLR